MMDVFLGVDPGVSGGLAVVMGPEAVTLKLKDATPRDVWDWLREYAVVARHAVIEKVGSTPQMGVVSAFTFGKSYGAIRAFLIALEVPLTEVSPLVWQKALGCRTKGDKNVSKARAQELWPKMKITHANADALLLAEYGRRYCAAHPAEADIAAGRVPF